VFPSYFPVLVFEQGWDLSFPIEAVERQRMKMVQIGHWRTNTQLLDSEIVPSIEPRIGLYASLRVMFDLFDGVEQRDFSLRRVGHSGWLSGIEGW
jgi:hypothetical protein